MEYNKKIHKIPEYFLEPEGYVICRVVTVSDKVYFYGYIDKSDLISFEKREIESIKLLHPYDEGKFSLIDAGRIVGVYIGEYKDLR